MSYIKGFPREPVSTNSKLNKFAGKISSTKVILNYKFKKIIFGKYFDLDDTHLNSFSRVLHESNFRFNDNVYLETLKQFLANERKLDYKNYKKFIKKNLKINAKKINKDKENYSNFSDMNDEENYLLKLSLTRLKEKDIYQRLVSIDRNIKNKNYSVEHKLVNLINRLKRMDSKERDRMINVCRKLHKTDYEVPSILREKSKLKELLNNSGLTYEDLYISEDGQNTSPALLAYQKMHRNNVNDVHYIDFIFEDKNLNEGQQSTFRNKNFRNYVSELAISATLPNKDKTLGNLLEDLINGMKSDNIDIKRYISLLTSKKRENNLKKVNYIISHGMCLALFLKRNGIDRSTIRSFLKNENINDYAQMYNDEMDDCNQDNVLMLIKKIIREKWFLDIIFKQDADHLEKIINDDISRGLYSSTHDVFILKMIGKENHLNDNSKENSNDEKISELRRAVAAEVSRAGELLEKEGLNLDVVLDHTASYDIDDDNASTTRSIHSSSTCSRPSLGELIARL